MKVSYLKYILFLFLAASCSSQKGSFKSSEQIIQDLRSHVQYLADDKLEGRRAGSNGEQLAREYIAGEFRKIGLTPKGTNEYFQPFEINDGKKINPESRLSLNGKNLELEKEYFPFPYSANKEIEALPVIDIQESEMPWFVDIAEILDENKDNPHFDLPDYIYNNAKKAAEIGASAILLFNSSTREDKLTFNPKDKAEKLSIPVVYIANEAFKKYVQDGSSPISLKLKVDIGDKKRTGHNVVGYIDNNAPTTVVLGAHYDHLGYGEDGNSMLRNVAPAIHNGADDNASGTASLIELARRLKASKATKNNYLFVAFSGEELGLFGSKYFVENSPVDLKSVSFMINMDMVGRLNDSSKVLTIGGIGTSPIWGNVLNDQNKGSFVYKLDSSGTGPSDHTSFYRKDIPVLFYFTGLHSDYHKPTDDAEKVNYPGMVRIMDHIYNLIEAMNDKGKPLFAKTRETQTSTAATFRVTLGIMPDYTYSGTGVRADGVTEGRPAYNAGLKAGDIILQLGEHVINSLENYMQALGKFKKGDKTVVKYKRGEELKEANLQF